ncbi:MSFD8 [Lepeophtheirus salmonis]|uniref:MSFD8 n=1 Tax=Lepeophtheirus salmonis TaxID=72036 RepID=A0A817FA04_LEPSM|nr:MSFD8 [Lepeophtheirus salmonis]CAG9474884.1 MSFD8 [Lepeophtheirus salmonis]
MNENPEQRKRRLRSIYVVHTSMFVFSLGFSINLTGVFPYMKQLLTNNSSEDILNRYGWVVAMNPLGQMIASPLLGYIFNKTNDLRSISMAMAVVYILGNSLYSILSLFPEGESRYIGLLSSRFIVGFASGISAPLRAYISFINFFSMKKTKHLSIVALFQTLGFIVGPGIQASLTPLKCGQPPISGPYFTLDMYTVAGWLSVFMGVFQERSLHNRNKTEADTKSISLEKPDYLAALISLLNFFVFQAVFVLLETLGTPLCMDNFAWSEETTVFYLGIIMSSGGVMSFICFLTIPPLSKKFDERYFYLLPLLTSMKAISTGTGCDYDWCNYVPVLQLWQMLVSYAVGSTSIPFCVTICSIIFTKLLGPRPQGVWMGALASSGSFARVIGPIIVSYIYRIYDDIEITKL